MSTVAHQIPECIVHKIMLQSYSISPHPTAVIMSEFIKSRCGFSLALTRRVIVFNWEEHFYTQVEPNLRVLRERYFGEVCS